MTYDPTVKVPGGREGRRRRAVGRRRPVHPAHAGLQVRSAARRTAPRLDTDRTAIPLELDQIYQSLDHLAVALGPEGRQQDGALTRLLTSTARNFGGQGAQFNETIHNLSRFTSTLDNNKDALFDTAREIERFVGCARGERPDRPRLQRQPGVGLRRARRRARRPRGGAAQPRASRWSRSRRFVKENKDALVAQHHRAGEADQHPGPAAERPGRDAQATAPVALANLYHTYNPRSGTLDTRANLGESLNFLSADPIETICEFTVTVDPDGRLCEQLKGGAGRAAPGAAPGRIDPEGVAASWSSSRSTPRWPASWGRQR